MIMFTSSRATNKLTAQQLVEIGVKPESPQELLRRHILTRLRELQNQGFSREESLQLLFPNTILEPEVLHSLVSALVGGNHVILFGPPGSGKTSLAKDIWNLFPKDTYVVDGCPVQESPFSLIDKRYRIRYPPCPFCRAKFGVSDDSSSEPEKIPVRKFRLREGYGFARIQGSSEVFPDNLTGSINIHKLETIGDPFSPLVLEPGKLLQANRGILLVDEIGKLPLGSQNVLLQALQEAEVTPAKSRETFPASFIAVCTSNLTDLDNITEPLNDRLTNIYVGFNRSHEKNLLIAELGLKTHFQLDRAHSFIPAIFIDGAVSLIERWRAVVGEHQDLSEVGSNRTMIDIIIRSEAYSRTAGNSYINADDFKRGVLDAMFGRVRARGGYALFENKSMVEEFVSKNLQSEINNSIRRYWCKYFLKNLGGNKSEGKKTIDELQKVVAQWHQRLQLQQQPPQQQQRELLDQLYSKYPRLRKFSNYVLEQERYKGKLSDMKLVLAVVKLLTTSAIFECDEK